MVKSQFIIQQLLLSMLLLILQGCMECIESIFGAHHSGVMPDLDEIVLLWWRIKKRQVSKA
jgi:hypothetical protein